MKCKAYKEADNEGKQLRLLFLLFIFVAVTSRQWFLFIPVFENSKLCCRFELRWSTIAQFLYGNDDAFETFK
jgi:hypothetical protein